LNFELVTSYGSRRIYYGWVVLAVAAVAMVGTLPGRTQGLGLITEPLLADLGVGRVRYAQMNLVATLAGSLFAFGIGSLLDRRGSRVVLTAVAAALGLVVIGMSAVTSAVALLLFITLTRGLGQTALSIVSLTMVGKWFRQKLTWAMGIYALAMSVGFMIAFPLVGAFVLSNGWRSAWASVGLALVFVLAPMAAIFVRSTPESVGDQLDGGDADGGPLPAVGGQYTFAEALRTPAFWVFATASSLYGLVASGIGLFNESILAERGFPPEIYHQALAITAITGLLGNFAAGAWAERRSLRTVLVTAMIVLAAGLAALPHVSTPVHVSLQAIAMGIAGGFVMVVFFSFWGRAYGNAHLGRIQGAAQAMTVLASAIGPLLLAESAEVTGSYAVAFYVLAATVIALGAAAAIVRVPDAVA
jgi:MFS family permease